MTEAARPRSAGDLPGLDLDRFTRWFDRACPGLLAGPVCGRLLAGGRSNLTYEVSDGVRRYVVRRPPLGHVLATAHDMAREHRVITALSGTGVPVPATYALCTDADVIGAPFYVMERVTGAVYRRAAQLATLGPQRTRRIAEASIDTLVALHDVDAAAVGLADFGRPAGFLARQVRRWKQQLDASRSRALPGIDQLYARLSVDPPDHAAAAVVHGDYRLDNLLVDTADRVVAVLDWEMATLGDPLTDVALLAVYHRLAGLGAAEAVADAPAARGYPSLDDLLDRYALRSGRDLSHLGFRLGLAAFKLAVILEGIHYRYLQGQTVGAGFEHVGDLVEPLVALGLRELGSDR